VVGDRLPALVLLTGDEGLGCFPLGIKGAEFLLESTPPWICVYRSRTGWPSYAPFRGTDLPARLRRYSLPLCFSSAQVRLKKRKPFHFVPATSLATALSDR
jgi:hypothetical protein